MAYLSSSVRVFRKSWVISVYHAEFLILRIDAYVRVKVTYRCICTCVDFMMRLDSSTGKMSDSCRNEDATFWCFYHRKAYIVKIEK